MTSDIPILYSYFRSSCAWRVRNALAVKGIEYEYQPVNLLKGEQIADDYKNKHNPMGQVPTFVYKDLILTQSLAILEFLEDEFPDKPLLPRDNKQKAKVREICDIIGSGIQPLQNLSVLRSFEEDKRGPWAHDAIKKGFVAIEKLLTKSSGTYCVGNDVTTADCCLIPQVYNAKRFSVGMNEFPIIQRVHDSLMKLEPFQKANYTNQIDCPESLK